jgi:hypothetical protein
MMKLDSECVLDAQRSRSRPLSQLLLAFPKLEPARSPFIEEGVALLSILEAGEGEAGSGGGGTGAF